VSDREQLALQAATEEAEEPRESALRPTIPIPMGVVDRLRYFVMLYRPAFCRKGAELLGLV
jgi:hypothetical protein